jgi:hypothetical protein
MKTEDIKAAIKMFDTVPEYDDLIGRTVSRLSRDCATQEESLLTEALKKAGVDIDEVKRIGRLDGLERVTSEDDAFYHYCLNGERLLSVEKSPQIRWDSGDISMKVVCEQRYY